MSDNFNFSFQFVNRPISHEEITNAIANHSSNFQTGAYNIFIGQVREDIIDNNKVESIDYTSNLIMAEKIIIEIIKKSNELYDLNDVKIIHSLGTVKKGEICLFILVACKRRKNSFKACEYLVENLKKDVPVWGKEILENKSHSWKENTY